MKEQNLQEVQLGKLTTKNWLVDVSLNSFKAISPM